jgi:hypothetical protein
VTNRDFRQSFFRRADAVLDEGIDLDRVSLRKRPKGARE